MDSAEEIEQKGFYESLVGGSERYVEWRLGVRIKQEDENEVILQSYEAWSAMLLTW